MSAKAILIRALQCIEQDRYVSADQALVTGTLSTAQRALQSLDESDITPEEELTYGPRVDAIVEWITNAPLNGDKFLLNCRAAVHVADTSPHKVAGFIVCLPAAHNNYLRTSAGLDRVTRVNEFAADAGNDYTGTGTIVNVQNFPKFYKVNIVDDDGFFVSYIVSAGKTTLLSVATGDKISISGKAYRNKFGTPFETSLVNTTVEKL